MRTFSRKHRLQKGAYMPNQKEILAQLERLDDAALQDMVRGVAAALGMSNMKARMLAANPSLVRRKLEAADPAEFQRLLAALDENSRADLLARLKADKPE